MKNKIKSLVVMGVFISTLFIGGFSAWAMDIEVELNSEKVWGINPTIENGTTLVPLRGVGDLLGASIDWDNTMKSITISKGDIINTLTIDNPIAYKTRGNIKSKVKLTTAPKIKDGVTYVPLRYIAESLDIKVKWDKDSNKIMMEESFYYKDKKIYFGDGVEDVILLLGKPSLIMKDEVYDYLFYVDDYNEVMIFLASNDAIVGFTTNAKSMAYRDLTYNATDVSHIDNLIIVKDRHEGDRLVGMGYNLYSVSPLSNDAILANERIIFELTNGFRAHNNKKPLGYNSKISDVARKHSKDMANKDYFSHTGLDGSSPGTRLERGGVNWKGYGENIAAGNGAGLSVFGQWLNSLGHRKNMLEQTGYLGVGSAYNLNSTYRYYHTQNFTRID